MVSIKRLSANSRQVARWSWHGGGEGLPGFVRILGILPRLPLSLPPTSVEQNAKAYVHPPPQACVFRQTEQSSDRFINWAARIILRRRSFLLSINTRYWTLQRFQQRQKEVLEQAQARMYLREYLRGTPLLKKTVKEDYYDDGTRRVHWRENELVELVQATIQELQSLGEPITRKTVAQKIGMSQPGLYRYASIRELVKEYTKPSQRGQSEVELVEQVQTAIKSLTSQGKPIGYQSVSQMIGVSKRVLRRYLRVRTVLDEAIEQASRGQYEAEVVALVQAAIERLEAEGEVVGYQSVSKLVGISQWVLQRQLRVRALVEDAKEKQQSEVEVMARVRIALETLTFSGEPIGYRTVGKTTKLPQKVLIRYRSVRELIEQNTNDQQREAEVLVKVHAAIQALEVLGESITLRNISKHTHLTAYTLKSYPRVRELLEQFFHAHCDERAREFQHKEDELVRRVQVAIHMLNSLNKPVTSRNLSEMMGHPARI